MIRRLAACVVLALAPIAVAAVELTLPNGARQLTSRVSPMDSYALPVGPFAAGSVPVRVFEGRVNRQTWRIDGVALTTLQLLLPMRNQIKAAGYELVFECADRTCGGFDFRFQTEVIPAPNMYVDIRNYRFVAAIKDDIDAISLLISRSDSAAFVQIIRVARGDEEAFEIVAEDEPAEQADPETLNALGAELVARGRVVLDGLEFQTGAGGLGPGPYGTLKQLAEFLNENPRYKVVLVGHTDSTGTLDRNMSLSKRRAAAVRDRMIRKYGVAPDRIGAEGMGYLAPVESNLTAQGREANRRVEVILLSGH